MCDDGDESGREQLAGWEERIEWECRRKNEGRGLVAVLFQRLRTHYALEAVGVVVLLLHNHDLLRDVLTARCTPRSKEAVVFSRGQNEVAAY